MKKRMNRAVLALAFLTTFVLITAGLYMAGRYNLLPDKSYTAEDFGIETILSPMDFNGNGRDDYADLLLGAKADAANKPDYDARYWAQGYPPDDIGVCTDVIWRAFKAAGYSLRDMVDADIRLHPEDYPNITVPDSAIDFRRLVNLKVFFARYAVKLTTDSTDISQWQPGDIVVLNDSHIGMVSDKRNQDGRVYILHNAGQPNREEDALKRMAVTAHYRFDASRIEADILLPFTG